MHNTGQIITAVISSVAEAELGYIHTKQAAILQQMLIEMEQNHPKSHQSIGYVFPLVT